MQRFISVVHVSIDLVKAETKENMQEYNCKSTKIFKH